MSDPAAAVQLDGRRERVTRSAPMQHPTSPRPTATLAELYARQGLLGRARAIYQELAAGQDGAAAAQARKRLEELGPSASGHIAALREILSRVQERRRAAASEG